MVFNSGIFLFVFLPVVFALFWLARTKRQRYVLLTLSGYVFYGYWDWRFCLLLLFSSLVAFWVGLELEKPASLARRRAWMIASVGVNLAILGFFKYYNFFAESVAGLFPAAGLPVLKVVLPIGISFYTFHTITYIVDVMVGRVRATRDLFEFLAYVSLFSQLVAGPIVRFRQIEDDLEAIDGPPREDWLAVGVGRFVIGMAKKVLVADQLAGLIDPMIGSYATLSLAGAWFAAAGYTFQLYYDFSGYSDMAVWLGLMFGLRIPENFRSPYQALNPRDFWRRWHISLSTCLRDYLYIPLGGNRGGRWRTLANLMVTMLLGGLWHGASWTFVVWGGYHGLLLVLDHVTSRAMEKVAAPLRRAITFLLVMLGWVLFRSSSFGMALVWLRKLVGLDAGVQDPSLALVFGVAACLVAVNVLPASADLRVPTGRRWAWVYASALFICCLFIHGGERVFLYYQF